MKRMIVADANSGQFPTLSGAWNKKGQARLDAFDNFVATNCVGKTAEAKMRQAPTRMLRQCFWQACWTWNLFVFVPLLSLSTQCSCIISCFVSGICQGTKFRTGRRILHGKQNQRPDVEGRVVMGA